MCKLKKKLRVALCAFMALVLVCSLTPASANIAEAADTDNQLGTGSVGYNCEWVLNKKTDSSDPEDIAELVIRPTGPNPTLSSHILNAIPSIDNQNSVTSIVIEGKIKAQSCNSLFAGFPKVRSINTGQLDTSSVTDFSFMFANNSLLKTITHNLDTGKATTMQAMFKGCKSLGHLDLTGLDTKSVTDMSYMFADCDVLANNSVATFRFNTSSVTNMSHMFEKCQRIGNPSVFSSWDTAKVSDMSYMFAECSETTGLDLSNKFVTSLVTDMSNMFFKCGKLKWLILSSFDTAKVKNYNYMFAYDSQLDVIYASSGFSVATNAYSTGMFYDCKSLVGEQGSRYDANRIDGTYARIEELQSRPDLAAPSKFGYFTTVNKEYPYRDGGDLATSGVSVVYIAPQVFTGGKVEPEPIVFQGNYVLKKDINYELFYDNQVNAGTATVIIKGLSGESAESPSYSGEIKVTFDIKKPEWETTEDGLDMFFNDGNLWIRGEAGKTVVLDADPMNLPWQSADMKDKITSLRIEPGVKATNCNGMFAGLSNLTELDISGLDTSAVSDFSRMFEGCEKLTNLDLRTLDLSHATTTASMFSNCSSLESIDFPNQVIRPNSSANMFFDCHALTSLDLTTFDMRSVQDASRMFEGCSSLTTIYATELFRVSANISSNMFLGCSMLLGGNGTTYNGSYVDGGRALIDKAGQKGYFTAASYEIDPSPIDGLAFMLSGTSFVYTGKAIQPTATVLNGSDSLSEGIDFTVSYANNTYPGTGSATITGKGLYKGSKTLTFSILAPMASVTPRLSAAAFTYDGNAKTPSVSCTIGGHALVNGRDYTVSYKNNVNAGTATAVITGHGSYVGTINYQYRINPASIGSVKFDTLVSMAYNKGKAIKQIPTGTYAGLAVKNGTHFTTSFKNNKKVGKATVTVTGKGNFAGIKSFKFSIVKYKQPMTAKAVTKTAKLAQVKKKAVKVTKPITVQSAKGTVTYTNVTTSGAAKLFTVNKKNGAITITKGTKKGTYKVKVKVEAKGKGQYAYGTKTVTVKIKVS